MNLFLYWTGSEVWNFSRWHHLDNLVQWRELNPPATIYLAINTECLKATPLRRLFKQAFGILHRNRISLVDTDESFSDIGALEALEPLYRETMAHGDRRSKNVVGSDIFRLAFFQHFQDQQAFYADMDIPAFDLSMLETKPIFGMGYQLRGRSGSWELDSITNSQIYLNLASEYGKALYQAFVDEMIFNLMIRKKLTQGTLPTSQLGAFPSSITITDIFRKHPPTHLSIFSTAYYERTFGTICEVLHTTGPGIYSEVLSSKRALLEGGALSIAGLEDSTWTDNLRSGMSISPEVECFTAIDAGELGIARDIMSKHDIRGELAYTTIYTAAGKKMTTQELCLLKSEAADDEYAMMRSELVGRGRKTKLLYTMPFKKKINLLDDMLNIPKKPDLLHLLAKEDSGSEISYVGHDLS